MRAAARGDPLKQAWEPPFVSMTQEVMCGTTREDRGGVNKGDGYGVFCKYAALGKVGWKPTLRFQVPNTPLPGMADGVRTRRTLCVRRYLANFLCFNRLGSMASGPSRRFLSSS